MFNRMNVNKSEIFFLSITFVNEGSAAHFKYTVAGKDGLFTSEPHKRRERFFFFMWHAIIVKKPPKLNYFRIRIYFLLWRRHRNSTLKKEEKMSLLKTFRFELKTCCRRFVFFFLVFAKQISIVMNGHFLQQFYRQSLYGLFFNSSFFRRILFERRRE